jgi:thermitase
MTTKGNKFIIFFSVAGLIFLAAGFDQQPVRTPRPTHPGFRSLDVNRPRLLNSASPAGSFLPDQVMVKFWPSVSTLSRSSFMNSMRADEISHIQPLDLHVFRIPEDLCVEEVLVTLRLNPDVEYAEPNSRTSVLVTPNDTLFSYQYALFNQGQDIGVPGSPQGTARADIKATEGWEEAKGSIEVVIGILDSGLDLLHPELVNKAVSGGRDFINDDFDATDDHYHGTMMASIAAAETNNGEGIAGVAWNCKVLPVKIVDQDGLGDYATLIEGLIWAADQGVDVINLSLGGDVPSAALESALEYAYEKGVVIAAAAGNTDAPVVYPAAYDQYCLAVAASDYNDQRVPWSGRGPQVDVAAPGERIIGAVPTWLFGPNSLPYAFGFGTSASTAHVSGLAALIKSNKPWLTNAEIMDVIRFTAEDINGGDYPGFDDFIGYGRINLNKALVPQIISSSK